MAVTGADKIVGTAQTGVREGVHTVGEIAAKEVATHSAVAGGVGLGAAVSAIVAQLEYEGKKRDMKVLLKEELSALTGKKQDKVKVKDMERLGDSSNVVADQLHKVKKERNVAMGTIFLATLATIAVVGAMAGGFGLLGASMFAPIAALGSWGPALAFGAKVLAGIVTYNLVKKPLGRLSEKLFDIDHKTSFERIEAIHKDREEGKEITRERVFAVFVHANPQLDQYIQSQYGKKFDNLNVADKLALTEAIGSKLGVNKITDDINHSRIKATELVFAVEGKMSGVIPGHGEQPKHTVLMTIKEKLHGVGERITGHHQEDPVQAQTHFVERTMRVPRNQMSHVQRLEEARAREALMAQQRV